MVKIRCIYGLDILTVGDERKKIINQQKHKQMAKTSKNVLGDQRGKIGKVVGRVVEGEQIYSSRPGPRGSAGTLKQKSHRAKFSAIAKTGRAMKGAIKIGLGYTAASKHLQSPFNIYVKRNIEHVNYNAETGVATPVYADIILSEGIVPYVTFGTPSFAESHQVTVSFTGNTDWPGAFEEDKVYVIAYCPDLVQSAMAIVTRSTETVTIQLPSNWEGKTIHLWGFALTSVTEKRELPEYGMEIDCGECSLTTYIGSGTVS